ncbi:MAG TPA: tRNA pseudouridine(38-40) synthase TruA [Candidatus Nanopelagicales bacterium]|nr:tRNA pseudouridine(38-40) synthase TruA [Candidatus Nanopelagicales bacterium]
MTTPGAGADPDILRWRLDVRYDGTAFSGWATQRGRRTVQGELQLWLGRVLELAEAPRLVCAGRTDAGVHARGQVAHLDLPTGTIADPAALLRRLRRALPPDLAVTAVTPAPAGFDARFAAIWRRYCYRIADPLTVPDPLHRGFVTTVARQLEPARLDAAAPTLIGLRDFGAFCKRREGATTVRTLLELSASRGAGGLIEVTVRADAFCHSMVRCLVGALVEVGSGRRDLDWLTRLTAAAVRGPEVPVMPAHGLTLEEVGYPPDDRLAARAIESRTRRTLSLDAAETGAVGG